MNDIVCIIFMIMIVTNHKEHVIYYMHDMVYVHGNSFPVGKYDGSEANNSATYHDHVSNNKFS